MEADVYDDVNEEEYQELVKKRREENFIDDDGAELFPLSSLKSRRLACRAARRLRRSRDMLLAPAEPQGRSASPPPTLTNLPARQPRSDGQGYVDFGQEDWDNEAHSGDEGEARKRAKNEGVVKGTGAFNNLAPRKKKVATERVSSMFLGAGREVIGAASKPKGKSATDEGGAELLSSLLGEVGARAD